MINKKILLFIYAIAAVALLISGCTGQVVKQTIEKEEIQDIQPVQEEQASSLDSFAKCLTDKGITMYGTEWCGYCNKQKALFGDSFQYVNFVDCDENKEACSNSGIRGYPSWIINSELKPGLTQLEDLASLSGCEI